MSFITRNKFWVGTAFAAVVVIALYIALVGPTRRAVSASMGDLGKDKSTLEGIKRRGKKQIATQTKVDACKELAGLLQEQYDRTGTFFEKRGGKAELVYFKGVLDDEGRPEGAVFVEKYEIETAEFEQSLVRDRNLRLGDKVFLWKDFGTQVPSSEECEPVMQDFRILEDITDVVIESKAVPFLESVRLKDEGANPIKVVDEDFYFYSRPFEIKANVFFSKLLDLIDHLHRSERNVRVGELIIEQTQVVTGGETGEMPVSVTLTCQMLRCERQRERYEERR